MNILIVSECDKRALVETRRICDQFAERKGSRTWQTPITQAGLDTLRGMLKRTARKNSAVACHWIRGLDHTELLWIVGDASRFNELGTVPTNQTSSDVLRRKDESDWVSAEDIKLITALAALFHDFGKASDAFQKKLKASGPIADAYRHEWVSLKLFESFVAGRSDEAWLTELASGVAPKPLPTIQLEGPSPFGKNRLGPIAQAVGWLVLSHHRLPTPQKTTRSPQSLERLPLGITHDWAFPREDASESDKRDCHTFSRGLPFDSAEWRRRAARIATQLLSRPALLSDASLAKVTDAFAMNVGRASLILADHFYSSEPSHPKYGDREYPLFANTERGTDGTSALKQRLDEHLGGVASHARRIVQSLVGLDQNLPRIARHKGFKRSVTSARFRWQDQAFDLATALRSRAHDSGFFGVNMASTGCGKTLANGRILYALADPKLGARFTIALGLRTLTLQTGAAYRERLELGEDDLAVMVGGAAVRELFAAAEVANPASKAPQNSTAEKPDSGSVSSDPLLNDNSYVHYAGSLGDGALKQWLERDLHVARLVAAPVLTCTIDHLMPATESTRGGHLIGPILRLLTSDLVLDEPDDFDLADIPALSRLVHAAGLYGTRVVLSSATLPPALVSGLFDAYSAGRRLFQRHRRPDVREAPIPCAWFDEFGCTSEACTPKDFETAHTAFAKRRAKSLEATDRRRHAKLVSVPIASKRPDAIDGLVNALPAWIAELHKNSHSTFEGHPERVSFGLIRMANVDPIIDVATRLFARGDLGFPEGLRIHLCVYHSAHPLLIRSSIERMLDTVLKRDRPLEPWSSPYLRAAINEGQPALDHAFVVLASPVAEVGRDHDYDWAIVEPSSMRSLIQLAGRVRRHRPARFDQTNIFVWDRNLKAITGVRPSYQRPGFENKDHRFESPSMVDLIRQSELTQLDATARILEASDLDPRHYLVDLEHRRLREEFTSAAGSKSVPWPSALAWTSPAFLSGMMPQETRFRASPPKVPFAFCYDEGLEEARFMERSDKSRPSTWTPRERLLSRNELHECTNLRTWGAKDYTTELRRTAELTGHDDLETASKRFGTIELGEREMERGWRYHPSLGFRRNTGDTEEHANDE